MSIGVSSLIKQADTARTNPASASPAALD